MKLIIAGVLAVVMGLAVTHRDSILGTNAGLDYVKQESTLEVQEAPKEAWMIDEDAIQAAKDVIRKKELEIELKAVDANILGEEKRHADEMKSLKDKRTELSKELGTY